MLHIEMIHMLHIEMIHMLHIEMIHMLHIEMIHMLHIEMIIFSYLNDFSYLKKKKKNPNVEGPGQNKSKMEVLKEGVKIVSDVFH